jgi:hypothetical protein
MPRLFAFAIFVASVAVSFAFGFFVQNSYGRLAAWLIVVGGVLAAVAAIPKEGPSLRAVLVDERNRYSQPALITLAWFVVIVSAYLACALWNVALWIPSPTTPLPIEIKVPPTVWVLAGIVGVDVIAASIIVTQKGWRAPSASHLAEAQRIGQPVPEAGTLFVRGRPADAEGVDFIAYDELGVQETVDLAALQKLLFQITAVIVYAVALGRLIYSMPVRDAISGFPPIPEGFLALIGVSTATAVINRAIPR